MQRNWKVFEKSLKNCGMFKDISEDEIYEFITKKLFR